MMPNDLSKFTLFRKTDKAEEYLRRIDNVIYYIQSAPLEKISFTIKYDRDWNCVQYCVFDAIYFVPRFSFYATPVVIYKRNLEIFGLGMNVVVDDYFEKEIRNAEKYFELGFLK